MISQTSKHVDYVWCLKNPTISELPFFHYSYIAVISWGLSHCFATPVGSSSFTLDFYSRPEILGTYRGGEEGGQAGSPLPCPGLRGGGGMHGKHRLQGFGEAPRKRVPLRRHRSTGEGWGGEGLPEGGGGLVGGWGGRVGEGIGGRRHTDRHATAPTATQHSGLGGRQDHGETTQNWTMLYKKVATQGEDRLHSLYSRNTIYCCTNVHWTTWDTEWLCHDDKGTSNTPEIKCSLHFQSPGHSCNIHYSLNYQNVCMEMTLRYF